MADIFNRYSEQFDQTVNGFMDDYLGNEYLSAGISLVLILYAGVIAPSLPENILKWMDNPAAKVMVFFLIGLTARVDPTVAIIASLAVYITLTRLEKVRFWEGMKESEKEQNDEESEETKENEDEKPSDEFMNQYMAYRNKGGEHDVKEFARLLNKYMTETNTKNVRSACFAVSNQLLNARNGMNHYPGYVSNDFAPFLANSNAEQSAVSGDAPVEEEEEDNEEDETTENEE